MGDLDRISFLEEGCWERGGVTFSVGGCSIYVKRKLKSEIFNDKKFYKQKNVFLCVLNNWNWEIFTKNLVTFKIFDGINKDEQF